MKLLQQVSLDLQLQNDVAKPLQHIRKQKLGYGAMLHTKISFQTEAAPEAKRIQLIAY